jgi:glucose-1-phosphate thymidylyltransferase
VKANFLAGGAGSRLYPFTRIASKQLQAVYDKPMIYYLLALLMAAGIREFCLISDPISLPSFRHLLGSGYELSIQIDYREQARPEGIAQAFLIASDFVGNDNVTLMLGDNIFSGGDDLPRAVSGFDGGATIFVYQVKGLQR